MEFGDLLGGCCGGRGGAGRLDYCSFFYAGMLSSLNTVVSGFRGGFVERIIDFARRNMYRPSSREFWRYVYREYVYPVLMLAAVYNRSKTGRCIGRVFSEEWGRVLAGEYSSDTAPEDIGLGLKEDIEENIPFIRVLVNMVLSTASGLWDGLLSQVSSDSLALLNEDLLEDLVLSSEGESLVILRPVGVFGGLTELFLWLFAARFARGGLVSGVFPLRNMLERGVYDYSLATRNRVVLLSYDELSRRYMVTVGHVPSGRVEVWLDRDSGVFSLNIFVLQGIKASDVLHELWYKIDRYVEHL